MQNKFFNATNNIISIILIIGILIIVNLISDKYFKRFDFTENKKYSISQGSKELMKELPSDIVIKGYFTQDMPTQYNEVIEYTKDMLNELAIYSDGKINIEIINPSELDDEEKKKMLYSGIRPIEAQILKEDKYEIKKGYMGMVMYYMDKKEVIPVVSNVATLEYDIISKVNKITSEREKTIGFIKSKIPEEIKTPEMKQNETDEFSKLKDVLNKKYRSEDLEIENGKLSNTNIDMLIVVEDKVELSNEQLLAIDQFVLTGKPVIFMSESYDVKLSQLKKSKIDSKLKEYFSNYGLDIGNEMIYDERNQRIRIQRQEGLFSVSSLVNYPYIPMVTNLNTQHPITSSLNDLAFIFASKLNYSKSKNINFEWLAKTSEKSYEYTPNSIEPGKNISIPNSAAQGPFAVGGILSGNFDSYFKDKEIPVENFDLKEKGNNKQIIVFGDSDFAKDKFIGQSNLALIENSIDWCMQAEELLKIRSKSITVSRLEEVSTSTKKFYKYLNILFVPIILILLGLIRIYSRKSKEGKVYEG